NNLKALVYTHYIIIIGFLITGCASLVFLQGHLSAFWWLTLVGLGLYTTYIPFNCIFFERLIATFKFPGNVGFLIYVADSFGYLGSVGVLISKEVFRVKLQWTSFYSHGVLALSAVGIVGAVISLIYFRSKYEALALTRALPALPVPANDEKFLDSVPS
ncbi:MAG TPA: DUF5690 family protein, partial [Puia sp.]|nr:DUF5690 family protein [Puia sp.]